MGFCWRLEGQCRNWQDQEPDPEPDPLVRAEAGIRIFTLPTCHGSTTLVTTMLRICWYNNSSKQILVMGTL
jgi:hypothetical protein